ncbi:MAG: pyrroloquinoline quinone biosynthesis protein PqqB [Flavobacteriaceae bacterium]|nr:pyrroloquinoline quinone biosynthesis protein PqqB [Flavobacteriaceae bacterium]|tara:strand:- start:2049 stop:2969 length:921 start_codon:yes stop_codon:yes gene_type:complete
MIRLIILFKVFFYSIFLSAQDESFLLVLGNVQDGGIPHMACKKDCCMSLTEKEKRVLKITSLAFIDKSDSKHYLFEASTDITEQLNFLDQITGNKSELDGIFLTHAHMGHYSGLLQLGREAMGAKNIPVYVMPKMSEFLKSNAPWSQLVLLNNIKLKSLAENQLIKVSNRLHVSSIIVPHRDEFSETVGFFIKGRRKTAFFLPDIDKWGKWDKSLKNILEKVDYAFLDGTFFDSAEINYRDISEIPHPFVIETMDHLSSLTLKERKKVFFIHMNHTNGMLNPDSQISKEVLSKGFQIARYGMQFPL